MAKMCELCGRGSKPGVSRSHSMIKTKRRFNVNLQWRKFGGRRAQICTNCIKTIAKQTR